MSPTSRILRSTTNGLYISFNEFNITPDGNLDGFIDAAIVAVSKNDLINGSGGTFPRVVRFPLPFSSGFEFTVWPAYTPPGGGPLLANGGTQFFVSSHFVNTIEHSRRRLGLDQHQLAQLGQPKFEFESGGG